MPPCLALPRNSFTSTLSGRSAIKCLLRMASYFWRCLSSSSRKTRSSFSSGCSLRKVTGSRLWSRSWSRVRKLGKSFCMILLLGISFGRRLPGLVPATWLAARTRFYLSPSIVRLRRPSLDLFIRTLDYKYKEGSGIDPAFAEASQLILYSAYLNGRGRPSLSSRRIGVPQPQPRLLALSVVRNPPGGRAGGLPALLRRVRSLPPEQRVDAGATEIIQGQTGPVGGGRLRAAQEGQAQEEKEQKEERRTVITSSRKNKNQLYLQSASDPHHNRAAHSYSSSSHPQQLFIPSMSSMKNKSKPSPPVISGLIFVLQPRSLTFKAPAARAHSLQLDRAGQTIKKIPQEIKLSPSQTRFAFPADTTDPVKLKLLSEHDLSFAWQLRDSSDSLVESAPVNLMEFYRPYVHSIIKNALNCQQLEQAARQGQLTAQQWEAERAKIQWKFEESVSKGEKLIQVAYRVEIWNEIDLWFEAQKQEREEEEDEPMLSSPPQSPKGRRKWPQPLTMLKRSSALSEIIECSNDGSSILNYNERHAELDEITGIPEEEESPYVHTGDSFRRTNTLDSNIYAFPRPQSLRSSRRKTSTPERYSEDGDKEDRSRLETQPHSRMEEAQEQKPEAKLNPRLIIVLLVCLAAAALLLYANSNEEGSVPPLKKAKKAGKPTRVRGK